MTLDEWLTELEELDKKATKGPWINERCDHASEDDSDTCKASCAVISKKYDIFRDASYDECHHIIQFEDAEFIAKSRTALPKAVKVIRAMAEGNEVYFGNWEEESELGKTIQKIINEESCLERGK